MLAKFSSDFLAGNLFSFDRRNPVLLPIVSCVREESLFADPMLSIFSFIFRTDVAFYVLVKKLGDPQTGTEIISTQPNSTVINRRLILLSSDEIDALMKANEEPVTNQQDFPVVSFAPGSTEPSIDDGDEWYEVAGLLGMILIPVAVILLLVIIIVVVYRRRNPQALVYTDVRPAGWVGQDRRQSHFKNPPTALAPSEVDDRTGDPLSVLYAGDSAYFGKRFENPLRSEAWWDVNGEMEEGFLESASVGIGMGMTAPASGSGVDAIFDASAVDPATGRTYFYNTITGERSWTAQ